MLKDLDFLMIFFNYVLSCLRTCFLIFVMFLILKTIGLLCHFFVRELFDSLYF